MDLVSQTSAKSGMKLKIALVATKCESTEVPATLLDSSEALLVWQVASGNPVLRPSIEGKT